MKPTYIRSKRAKRLPVAVALIVAATVFGCGGSNGGDASSDPATEAQARATVERFYAALKNGDAAGVCATLAAGGREEIVESLGEGKPGDSCADAFERFIGNARRAGGLSSEVTVDIQSVKVTGDEAVAKVTVGGGPVTELPLTYNDGRWQVTSAAATG